MTHKLASKQRNRSFNIYKRNSLISYIDEKLPPYGVRLL